MGICKETAARVKPTISGDLNEGSNCLRVVYDTSPGYVDNDRPIRFCRSPTPAMRYGLWA